MYKLPNMLLFAVISRIIFKSKNEPNNLENNSNYLLSGS